jgi:hypothetical protein
LPHTSQTDAISFSGLSWARSTRTSARLVRATAR